MSSRGKNKVQNPFAMKEMYLDYISDKIMESPYYITFQEFLDICGDYYKEMSRLIIYESKDIKLPFRLGHITIIKKKPKKMCASTLSTDWKETRRLGRWIYHINDHSSGFKFRFFWSKKTCYIVNQDIYRLVFTRANKRELAKVIKSGSTDYLEIA